MSYVICGVLHIVCRAWFELGVIGSSKQCKMTLQASTGKNAAMNMGGPSIGARFQAMFQCDSNGSIVYDDSYTESTDKP